MNLPKRLSRLLSPLSRFLTLLFAFIFTVTIGGPLGNWFYDQIYRKPVPEILAFLNANWRWGFPLLLIIGLLAVWSYRHQALVAKQQADMLSPSDQEPVKQPRGPLLSFDKTLSATVVHASFLLKGTISELLWGHGHPADFEAYRQRSFIESVYEVEECYEELAQAEDLFPNFWRDGFLDAASKQLILGLKEPVGIQGVMLRTQIRVTNVGDQSGAMLPLQSDGRLHDTRWTLPYASLAYKLSLDGGTEEPIMLKPGESHFVPLNIYFYTDIEDIKKESQKYKKAYMKLRSGQAFRSYLEGLIQKFQLNVDLSDGNIQTFEFALQITQGWEKLHIKMIEVEDFILTWSKVQAMGESRWEQKNNQEAA